MAPLGVLLALSLALAAPTAVTAPARASPAATGATAAGPGATPTGQGPVILFLIDNSASLPPLDPDEKRVAALEKMFTFLEGQPYRLILFGGRNEVYVDDASRYNNKGKWTDFYFAFSKAQQLMSEYPPGTDFRVVLLTDALLDPGPEDWEDMGVPTGADLRIFVAKRTIELIQTLNQPLYVILIGQMPADGAAGPMEQAPPLVVDMVQAANGRAATPFAQSLASFFGDNGTLLRKFVYRIQPDEGLKKVEPVIKRIAKPGHAAVEVQLLSVTLVPLLLFLLLFVGILVRSFPGPGDLEIVELSLGVPAHLAVDRMHKIEGGWASTGLSLVGEAREAAGSLVYQAPTLDLTGKGLDTDGLEPVASRLLGMSLDTMRTTLDDISNHGTRDEKIFALNLDYMAKNMDAVEAESILTTNIPDRKRVNPLDFVRAKAHLLSDEPLRQKLVDARLQYSSYGRKAERKELRPGSFVRIGRYGFLVRDLSRGGRKDCKVVLYYDRVPSVLGLKTIVPDFVQRLVRFRRSSQRVVG